MKSLAVAISMLGLGTAAAAAEPDRPPPPMTFAVEADLELGPAEIIGDTAVGRRQSVPVLGGSFTGPRLSGRILPGGSDYQLVRSDGAVTIDADFIIETDDHVKIHVRNLGVVVPPKAGAGGYAWTAPSFDAPAGPYGWMSDTLFVSRVGVGGDRDHRVVRLTVFKVG